MVSHLSPGEAKMLDSSTDLKSMLSDPSLLQVQAFINNEWVDAENSETFNVKNPARGDVIAQVADLSRTDLAHAISGAEVAQKKVGCNICQRAFEYFTRLVQSNDGKSS